MSAMDWDKLRIFHAVAAAGSFTHAGEKLNLSQSAVSRQISALEESVRASLFHRHARGLILTEQGELLFNTVRESKSCSVERSSNRRSARRASSGALNSGSDSTWVSPS